MATLKQKIAEARNKGISVPSGTNKEGVEDLLQKAQSEALVQPTAGVEGRSLDSETDLSNAEQSTEGEFTKVYVIAGEGFNEEDIKRNFQLQAQQVGVRLKEEVTIESVTKGNNIRVTCTAQVIKATVVEDS